MPYTTSRPSVLPRRSSPARQATPARQVSTTATRARHERARHRRSTPRERRALGHYTTWDGRRREIVARRGHAGSVLVLDRDALTLADARLVAHLAADEAPENAALICRCYLQDVRRRRCRCRRLTVEDSRTAPFADKLDDELDGARYEGEAAALDRSGAAYRLELLQTGMSIPELRWRRHPPPQAPERARAVSVRDVVARLESYEPVRALTRRAVQLHGDGHEVSSAMLRAELARLEQSPIILNRKLRQVVLAAAEREGLSMSEIAIRCGRVKRDRHGNESGETSWLARRLGILPEGGRDAPTPWIHSDVLALIARRGLGISPREVEPD